MKIRPYRVYDNIKKRYLLAIECTQLVVRPLSGVVTDGATTTDVTLYQCTGMLDIHQRLIYEGDKVCFYYGPYESSRLLEAVIEWDNELCCYICRVSPTFFIRMEFTMVYEIVGNIKEA